MFLLYNNIPLELLTLDRVSRRTVLTPDETDVLYSEWDISASCVYHPSQLWNGTPGMDQGGTSVLVSPTAKDGLAQPLSPLGQNPQFPALTFPGDQWAIRTDKFLQQLLSIPRRPLIIGAYDGDGETPIVWLESPRRTNPNDMGLPANEYLTRDAVSGPIVQATVVTAALGQGLTFGVQLEIRTWVPPCPFGSDRLVLAHRWQMSHEHDEDYYLTRVITGEMWFHGGLKDYFGKRPDLVARQLFHPIPLGFRRHLGPITRSPDGLVVRYSFADTDVKVVFDAGRSGATHMAISENIVYAAPLQGLWADGARVNGNPGGAPQFGPQPDGGPEMRGDPNHRGIQAGAAAIAAIIS